MFPLLAPFLLLLLLLRPAHAADLTIVAAENFYGDIAAQLAGPHARVSSILSNPDEDPHLFEASPSVARDLAQAQIVIENGADYDPWIGKLLRASPAEHRQLIQVAALLHRPAGGNPHLWYDPATMPVVAGAIHDALVAADPADRADYDTRLQHVLASLRPIAAQVSALHAKFDGVPVAATEPVFGLMAAAIGLSMHDERFQLAVMNNTEPGASDVAQFESDLRGHAVRLLIYNSQATDQMARRLLNIARTAGVPVLGVTETEPAGVHYQQWIGGQLQALDHALTPSR